ncbi:MAG: putative dsRNA-binding protein [Trueperaceae bacterium]|nr:putative dsRNA-binding protein [Trueperaceae bacterium]
MIHPKAALIERLQKDGRGKPQFVTEREGPDHEPTFLARVKVQGQPFGEGRGGNKREAERRAAEEALANLDRDAAESPKSSGRRKPRKASGRGDAPVDAETPAETDAADVAAFAGPWPIFDRVLAEAMRIAHERVDADLRGDAALVGIETFAVRLYQDVLEELGEVVEEDEAG